MNSIPGVGKKTAERLILELKDKLKYDDTGAEQAVYEISDKESDVFEDALSALINLGYKKGDIEKTFNILKKEKSDNVWAVESLIKESLKVISK